MEELLVILIMKELNFLWKRDFNKIEAQNNICINMFGYENELVYPIFTSKQTFEDSMDELGLCHDFSSPGLSWDAMLKITGIELEKISDID